MSNSSWLVLVSASGRKICFETPTGLYDCFLEKRLIMLFLLYSGDDGGEEPVAYDMSLDNDDVDDGDDDDGAGAVDSNDMEKHDFNKTDDVRQRDESLTSLPCRQDTDLTSSASTSPSRQQQPRLAAAASSSPTCSATQSPQPCRATGSLPPPPPLTAESPPPRDVTECSAH